MFEEFFFNCFSVNAVERSTIDKKMGMTTTVKPNEKIKTKRSLRVVYNFEIEKKRKSENCRNLKNLGIDAEKFEARTKIQT